MILHILGKEKYGREPKGFESLDVINQMFVDEVKDRLSNSTSGQASGHQVGASAGSKNELQSLQA